MEKLIKYPDTFLRDSNEKVEFPLSDENKIIIKYLMQYRWRCTFRDAYYVCCLIYPYSITKLEKVKQILDHYQQADINKDKVVSLDEYRLTKAFNWNLHGT